MGCPAPGTRLERGRHKAQGAAQGDGVKGGDGGVLVGHCGHASELEARRAWGRGGQAGGGAGWRQRCSARPRATPPPACRQLCGCPCSGPGPPANTRPRRALAGALWHGCARSSEAGRQRAGCRRHASSESWATTRPCRAHFVRALPPMRRRLESCINTGGGAAPDSQPLSPSPPGVPSPGARPQPWVPSGDVWLGDCRPWENGSGSLAAAAAPPPRLPPPPPLSAAAGGCWAAASCRALRPSASASASSAAQTGFVAGRILEGAPAPLSAKGPGAMRSSLLDASHCPPRPVHSVCWCAGRRRRAGATRRAAAPIRTAPFGFGSISVVLASN